MSRWQRALLFALARQAFNIARKCDHHAERERAAFDHLDEPRQLEASGTRHADNAATLDAISQTIRGAALSLEEIAK